MTVAARGMIRLQPQVARSEDRIADLRRQLGEAERLSLDQHSELTRAQRQIRELSAELDHARREQQTLLESVEEVEQATEASRKTAHAAQIDQQRVLAQVADLNDARDNTLEALAHAECCSAELFNQMSRSRGESQEIERLLRETSKHRADTLSRLAANSRKQASTQLQWEGIVTAVKEQRSTLAALRESIGRDSRSHAADSVMVAELRSGVLRMEAEEKELRKEIAPLHGWDTKYFKLRSELEEATASIDGVRSHLGSEEKEAQRLQAELQRVEYGCSGLGESLATAAAERIRMESVLNESRLADERLRSELRDKEEASVMMQVSLTRLEQEEHHGPPAETRGSISRLQQERSSLAQRDTQLQEECAAARSELQASASRGSEFREQVNEQQSASSQHASENSELEQTLQELKNKGGCVVA